MVCERVTVDCCRVCPFVSDWSANDYGEYGCHASDKVSGEMRSPMVDTGVSPDCPLRVAPITVELSHD